ncbi:unnamed protein product [Amaranthus hypochondriacus]
MAAAAKSSPVSEMVIIYLLLLFLLLSFPSASALSSTSRTLLQAQQGCPVNFENLNYTIITSRCKGPRYPPKICCDAFRDLACPYAVQLNDQTNNCATTMFSYINLNGHYPPGLFGNECRDSKRGLECTEAQSAVIPPPTPSAAAPPIVAQLCLFSFSLLFLYRVSLF